MNEPLEREVAVLNAALELSPAERAAYLDQACAGDAALRRRVEDLLHAHEQAESFLETPSAGLDFKRTVRVDIPLTEKPGDRIGRYKLLQQIGEGGCGAVYMAEQEEPVRRRVALKVIKLGMDTKQVIARFEAERQALALMDHPNIAKVFDAGVTEGRARHSVRAEVEQSQSGAQGSDVPYLSPGRPYFVMELVRGVKITEFCDENKLPTEERLKLFIQVCQAIQHAHQKGIIHRDIKPSNILVTINDGVPVPKVIDFGIAKATQGRLTDQTLFTAFEQFLGTPAYMSPEQAVMTSLDIDTRSDIYSLGVLLYELLTGQTPFDTRELMKAGFDEMRRIIREQEPLKPSTCLSSLRAEELTTTAQRRHTDAPKLLHVVRGDLDWIVMKCLEKDRARRYETANGVAADIQRHLNCEPVIARPPSKLYEFHKTVRRHKFGFAAAAGLIFVLTIGVAISTWQAVRATRARDDANRYRAQSEQALSSLQIRKAEELRTIGNRAAAIAYLSRVLRSNPTNHVAIHQLISLTTHQSYCSPITRLFTDHQAPILHADISSDGQRLVTTSYDNSARILHLLTGQTMTSPLQHDSPVTAARFSPDGQRIVTASKDRTARVWDAHTGQPVTEPLLHDGEVVSACFSPDGQRVVTASSDKTARIWDANTGKMLTKPLEHKGEVVSALFSPDGQRVVTASHDTTARIWDSYTGQTLTNALRHEDWVVAAQFSPDGQKIVTTSTDQTARIWDAHTGQPLTEPLRHLGGVWSAEFSPDGQRVVTASSDKTARIWDANTGKMLTEPLEHNDQVTFAQFSPDGQRVVTALDHWFREEWAARIWDARTGSPLTEELRHEAPIIFAQFSPDGLRLVTVTEYDVVRQWDATFGLPLVVSLQHTAQVRFADFSQDGKRVVTASEDKTARIWDAYTGQPLAQPLNHEGKVNYAEFSPDGQRVVTAAEDKTARIWDAHTGQIAVQPLIHETEVESVRFSPDGQRVATVSDNFVRLWHAYTGRPLSAPLRHTDQVWSAEFSPDGQRLLTASSAMAARIWDAYTGQRLTQPLKHGGAVFYAQFSPDGQRVVTAANDQTARIWDAHAGHPLTEPLKHVTTVFSAKFSPNGQRVLTVSGDFVRLWDARTSKPLTEPLLHLERVWSAEFSPDGQRVVTAAHDKTARVWDVLTGHPLTQPLEHEAPVGNARFSPDGQRLVTVSEANSARLWEVPWLPVPAPSWVPELAEAIAGERLHPLGHTEAVPRSEILRLSDFVRTNTALDPYSRWAKWLSTDRRQRTISPFSRVTVSEYVQRRIEEDTLESLREAVWISPTNALALARLAAKRLEQSDHDNPHRVGEAEFLSRHAVTLWPNSPEVQRLHTEIADRLRTIQRR